MITIKKYFATWCMPCQQLNPILEEVKKENPNVNFLEIDVDNNKELALQDGVKSVPTVIFEKNGQQIHRFSGLKPKAIINNIINQYS